MGSEKIEWKRNRKTGKSRERYIQKARERQISSHSKIERRKETDTGRGGERETETETGRETACLSVRAPSWLSYHTTRGSSSSVKRKGCALLEQLHRSSTNRNSTRRQESKQLVFNPGEHWKLLKQQSESFHQSCMYSWIKETSNRALIQLWPNDIHIDIHVENHVDRATVTQAIHAATVQSRVLSQSFFCPTDHPHCGFTLCFFFKFKIKLATHVGNNWSILARLLISYDEDQVLTWRPDSAVTMVTCVPSLPSCSPSSLMLTKVCWMRGERRTHPSINISTKSGVFLFIQARS